MDQHIISFLSMRESGRHNLATEQETRNYNAEVERHNRKMEQLERDKNWTARLNAQTAAQAQTTAAWYSRQATETAARLNAEAHKYAASASADVSRYNTGMRYLESLMSQGVERSRIAMQSRYNTSSLALSAKQLAETIRSNRAREAEATATREQHHYFDTWEQMRRDESLKWDKLSFYDNLHQRQQEDRSNTYRSYITAMGNLGSGFLRAAAISGGGSGSGQTVMKGGNYNGQEQTIFDKIDEELRRQGR